MARPKGSKTRRKIIRNELGAQGSFCNMDELIEKIGEVIHEHAKITAIFLHNDGLQTYRIEDEAGHVFECAYPVIYTDTVALLEDVIERVKGE